MAPTGEATNAKKTQSKAAKNQTVQDIIAKKKAVMEKVDLQMDGEISVQIDELRALWSAARDTDRTSNAGTKSAPKIQKQIDTLVEESQATIVTFTFKSIGRF